MTFVGDGSSCIQRYTISSLYCFDAFPWEVGFEEPAGLILHGRKSRPPSAAFNPPFPAPSSPLPKDSISRFSRPINWICSQLSTGKGRFTAYLGKGSFRKAWIVLRTSLARLYRHIWEKNVFVFPACPSRELKNDQSRFDKRTFQRVTRNSSRKSPRFTTIYRQIFH